MLGFFVDADIGHLAVAAVALGSCNPFALVLAHNIDFPGTDFLALFV